MCLRARDLDILNQLNPSGPKPKTDLKKSVDPGLHSQLESARHFVKFVFPRQHGLPNPFTKAIENAVPSYNREIEVAISVSTGVIPSACVTDRRLQARGSMRTPKRINGALDYFEKLIWRHGKCGYKPLLNTACPSKVSLSATYTGRDFIYLGFRSTAACRKQISS